MKNCIKRALKTFIQAFIASLSVQLTAVNVFDYDTTTFKKFLLSLLISSVAAGLAALMNLPELEVKKDE